MKIHTSIEFIRMGMRICHYKTHKNNCLSCKKDKAVSFKSIPKEDCDTKMK